MPPHPNNDERKEIYEHLWGMYHSDSGPENRELPNLYLPSRAQDERQTVPRAFFEKALRRRYAQIHGTSFPDSRSLLRERREMRKDHSKLSNAIGCTLLVLILVTAVPRTTFAAQETETDGAQKQHERAAADAEEIASQVAEELERIDIDAIVQKAMEGARVSLEQARIQQQVQKSLEKVDIDGIVSRALEHAQRSIEAAKIQGTVQAALTDEEAERVKAEALGDALKTLEEVDVAGTVREALESLNSGELAKEIEAAIAEAKIEIEKAQEESSQP